MTWPNRKDVFRAQATAIIFKTLQLRKVQWYCYHVFIVSSFSLLPHSSLSLLSPTPGHKCKKDSHLSIEKYSIFIGPESDHWLCLSLTPSLTHWLLLVNLIYVSLTCEDGNSKLVEIYSVMYSIQFLKVVKSFSRLESNSVTFLQLIEAVKTSTVGATIWSIFYFDFAYFQRTCLFLS